MFINFLKGCDVRVPGFSVTLDSFEYVEWIDHKLKQYALSSRTKHKYPKIVDAWHRFIWNKMERYSNMTHSSQKMVYHNVSQVIADCGGYTIYAVYYSR